jgi:hypothetical protein
MEIIKIYQDPVFEFYNKVKDLIEKIQDYEKLNIFDLHDKFRELYFPIAIETLIACRHYIDSRDFKKRIRVNVEGREREIDVIENIERVNDKRKERIKRILEEKDLFRLYLDGVELPTDSLRNIYYLDLDNNIFRSIKERKLLKELYQREPEVTVYIFDNVIISDYGRGNISVLPNPDFDVEKVIVLYIELDPILIRFVKSF